MSRLNYASASPEGYKKFIEINKYLAGCGLDETILNLVYLRVSQINGCSYCVDLHWQDAKKAGEDLRRLNAVVTWRKTNFFSDKERAALNYAEAVTKLEQQQVSDADYDEAAKHFNDKELADLTYAIAHMNALNRLAVPFKKMPI